MKNILIPYISEYEINETVNSQKNSSAKQCIKHYIKPLTYLINS